VVDLEHFNPLEFDGIKIQAGLNSFVITPKRWIESINAIDAVKLFVKPNIITPKRYPLPLIEVA